MQRRELESQGITTLTECATSWPLSAERGVRRVEHLATEVCDRRVTASRSICAGAFGYPSQ
jgi:hypothetical protein